MDEMLLLGAGASVGAGVPSSYPMTQAITARFAERDVLAQYRHLLNFVIGGLLLQKGVRGENPFHGVDVEELFSAVMLLAERHSLEAAPFVGSWHYMVEQLDKATPDLWSAGRLHEVIYESVTREIIDAVPTQAPAFAGYHIDDELARLLQTAMRSKGGMGPVHVSLGRRVEEYVSKFMGDWLGNLRARRPHTPMGFGTEFVRAVKDSSRSGGGKVYRDTASLMIRMLVEIVWIDSPDRVLYLTPLLNPLARQRRLTIATLNYDNSIELAAGSRRVPCNTGIDTVVGHRAR